MRLIGHQSMGHCTSCRGYFRYGRQSTSTTLQARWNSYLIRMAGASLSKWSNVWGNLPACCTLIWGRTHFGIWPINQRCRMAWKLQRAIGHAATTPTVPSRAQLNHMLGMCNWTWTRTTPNHAGAGNISGYYWVGPFHDGHGLEAIFNVQSAYLLCCNSLWLALSWIAGLITQLQQVTHSQWIYRCVPVHDQTTGTLISAHKEDLLWEIVHQLTLGPAGLAPEDRFLRECNFDESATTNSKHQECWPLAIHAAKEACHICTLADRSERQSIIGIM